MFLVKSAIECSSLEVDERLNILQILFVRDETDDTKGILLLPQISKTNFAVSPASFIL